MFFSNNYEKSIKSAMVPLLWSLCINFLCIYSVSCPPRRNIKYLSCIFWTGFAQLLNYKNAQAKKKNGFNFHFHKHKCAGETIIRCWSVFNIFTSYFFWKEQCFNKSIKGITRGLDSVICKITWNLMPKTPSCNYSFTSLVINKVILGFVVWGQLYKYPELTFQIQLWSNLKLKFLIKLYIIILVTNFLNFVIQE